MMVCISFFFSPEALLSNETWRDMVPSHVYQENLVAVIMNLPACMSCDFGKQRDKLHSALERKPGTCYQTYFFLPFPPRMRTMRKNTDGLRD